MPIGTLIKTYMEYDKPYWREKGYNGSIFDFEGPIRYSVDGSPPEGYGTNYSILGYTYGDTARQLETITRE